jgi:hypothetical protein
MFGQSPVLWRTGSGNYAMPYRYNGEARRIRPVPDLPIDVLGSGGYAVAPPSAGAERRYEFLEGSLADFERLPTIRLPANENKRVPDKIPIGKRSDVLFDFALEQARYADDLSSLLDVVRTRNMDCEEPLPDMEVVKTASPAW